jgi:hypothetical protein
VHNSQSVQGEEESRRSGKGNPHEFQSFAGQANLIYDEDSVFPYLQLNKPAFISFVRLSSFQIDPQLLMLSFELPVPILFALQVLVSITTLSLFFSFQTNSPTFPHWKVRTLAQQVSVLSLSVHLNRFCFFFFSFWTSICSTLGNNVACAELLRPQLLAEGAFSILFQIPCWNCLLSNHNGGLAIDTSDWSARKTVLEANSWDWYGDGDKVHYTYVGSGTQVKKQHVFFFSRFMIFFFLLFSSK